MKLQIRFLFVVLLNFISYVLIAQSVSITTAKAIAENHLESVSRSLLKSIGSSGKSFHFTSVEVSVENKDTLYYILNDTINKGFVIVSADKRAWPILGYSTEGCCNVLEQPEAFSAWMDSKKREIAAIKSSDLHPDSTTIAAWRNMSLKNASANLASVEPLLKTKWGQGCYYNEMCPLDNRSPFCGHALTGCIATAMAQIMKYWNYPTKGKGSNSYPWGEYGTIFADFEATTYHWDQMPDSLTDSNEAVATIMYHCGVAAGMGYGIYGSFTSLYPEVLVDYFDYSSNIKLVNRKDYTESEWYSLLKAELDLGHPLYYTIPGLNHALVCDGYKDAYFFHFNWGWGGTNDGYYYLINLNSQSTVTNQTAIINIVPDHLPDGYEGLILSSNALVLNATEGVLDPISITVSSSSNWTATSSQSWISLSENIGQAGTSILKLSTTENSSISDRTAIVTIDADGFASQLIAIKQVHRYNVTAGGLKELLGDALSSTTNLCLKGTVDARDFKTMRDLMPALESVDLSKTSIVAYSGYDGPSRQSQSYLANAVPEHAFAFGESECSRLVSFVFPNSVTSIGDNAFVACMNLTNFLLPPSLQSIGDHNFDNCYRLGRLFIPSSVLVIGEQVYDNNISITVDPDNPNYMSDDGVLYNKDKTVLIYCKNRETENFKIPETVKEIDFCAFNNCVRISLITIPLSVNTIGVWAFNGCTSLASITIPSSVDTIRDAPFFGCRSLRSITVGRSIPVDLKASSDVFLTIDKDSCILNVPYHTAALYRAADQWCDFKNIVEAPYGFRLDVTEANLTSEANSTANVQIESDVDWTVLCGQSWLTVDHESGNGDQALTFTAEENTSTETRTAIVTVYANDVEPQIIKVIQQAKVNTGISANPEFKIYPNPTTGKILLIFDEIPATGVSVTVNDINGLNCFKKLIREKEEWIELSGNVPGVYFVKTDQENYKTQKIILK